MKKVNFLSRNGEDVTISAVLNFPGAFDEKKKYPAVVVSHPGGGVKEQTAGTYARKLAEKGFVTIAYDASYQGESTGEPRQLENPYIRTEDVSAAIRRRQTGILLRHVSNAHDRKEARAADFAFGTL